VIAVLLNSRKQIIQRLTLRSLCFLLLILPLFISAQTNSLTLDDLLQSAEQWANENLDDDALRVLKNADRQKIQRLFADIQKELQGEYVIDLASLRTTAKSVLPLLERYEETLPYALWLKTRLDYLDVADELRIKIPPPKSKPSERPREPGALSNPPPQLERQIWIEKLSERPWPATARTYVSRLKPIFIAQKVPPELVWLAEVESSFDPRARSHSGAAGLFQLMPDTAKRFGLRTFPFDQRLAPDESALAAAKYLQYLHRHFNDWRLALAAYNAGEGTVQNLLTRHKAHTFDEIATRLPAETQLYVPKVEATILRREGLKLNQLRTS
jgi:Soluble lytic murein transglycosylase and related regulatory proteins (some contain LysM/invasin domains)